MSTQTIYDVAVVGAGPAGATAAYILGASGRHVLLLDKKSFPRPKLCAGLLTWKTIELLKQIFQTPLNELKVERIIVHACREYRIYFHRSEIARGCLDFPFHFVDRAVYDHHWLKMAQMAGAQVQTGIAVTRVDPMENSLILSDGRRVKARIIIGADGVWSKVRNAMPKKGISKHRWRRHLAATIETYRTTSAAGAFPKFASLHFGFLPWGYAWSFPGAGCRSLGLAGLVQKDNRSPRCSFQEYLHSIDVSEEQTTDWQGYPLPYGNFLSKPAHQNILLIGDACGLADPLLGEGIYYAHRSAQLAALAIINAGSHQEEISTIYRSDLNRSVLRELRWIKLFRAALFLGGRRRRYRGLKLFFRLFPKRLEEAVQGRRSFSRLLWP